MTKSGDTFTHKVALIFGGAHGIGRAIALEFAHRGARVAVADIDSESAAATAADIVLAGGEGVSRRCDVTSEAAIEATLDWAEAELGELDIVVNNVGVIISGNPQDIPLTEWQRVVELNLFPVVRSNAFVLPRLLSRARGHIVNTASFAGLYPYATNRIPYATSKAAVIALTESLALYLEPKGIRVSCFCPGPVMTNVMKSMTSWSDNALMSGPGSQYHLITAQQAAVKLADGMAAGNIFIPTHDHVLASMQAHASDPDGFIRQQIAAIARGDLGLPKH